MSLNTLRNRSIKIIPVARTERDEYNNEVDSQLEGFEVRATREQLTSSEDITDRQQFARTFRYFLPAVLPNGQSLSGLDLIEDEGKQLRIVGEPNYLTNNVGRYHHVEVIAELIEG